MISRAQNPNEFANSILFRDNWEYKIISPVRVNNYELISTRRNAESRYFSDRHAFLHCFEFWTFQFVDRVLGYEQNAIGLFAESVKTKTIEISW